MPRDINILTFSLVTLLSQNYNTANILFVKYLRGGKGNLIFLVKDLHLVVQVLVAGYYDLICFVFLPCEIYI